MKKRLLIVCCALCSLMACNSKTDTGTTLSGLKKADFDTTVSGKKVALYELKNKNGVEVAITNYGGRIVSIWVPDRNGKFGDIMLAHSSIADYIADQGGNFGALIGRYGNRINQGVLSWTARNTNCLKIITVTAYTEATPDFITGFGMQPNPMPRH